MKHKLQGISRQKMFLSIIALFVILGLVFSQLVLGTGDTIRIKHVNEIATSIRANSLGKMAIKKYFYPTHIALLNVLQKSHLDIPAPYGNICYFIGTVQNEESNTSDFVVLTWGMESSTLDPHTPGVIFETSSPIIKNTMQVLSPTIDMSHFSCSQNKSIPWKKNMSSLLKMKLFPTHWLKINQDQQVCIGITDQEMPKDIADCLPD